jgi:flagellar basal body-associated protein FliL
MRWLRIGTALVVVLIVAMLVIAWHSATRDSSADAIKARTEAQMQRIEAEAQRLENQAAAP